MKIQTRLLYFGTGSIRVGDSGFVSIYKGKGDDQGQCLISADAAQEGSRDWNLRDADSKPFVQSLVQAAIALPRTPWRGSSTEFRVGVFGAPAASTRRESWSGWPITSPETGSLPLPCLKVR